MSESQRQTVLKTLPSEFTLTSSPPEGDFHRVPKERAFETLDAYYRRLKRKVYLSAELPVYYPDQPVIAPDLIAVLDVETHFRQSWVVSHEKRGIDFALEICVLGSRKKDFKDNVVRYAMLGIQEYVAFDPIHRKIAAYRLKPQSQIYEPIVPQQGRWHSQVLELDISMEGVRIRFYHGTAPLLESFELIDRLERITDEVLHREIKLAEELYFTKQELKESKKSAKVAQKDAQSTKEYAARLAARLRELGVDPDSIK